MIFRLKILQMQNERRLFRKAGMSREPTCYVIAGPNGAGKTTFALRYLPRVAQCAEFVNADLIARGLSPFHEEGTQLAAGRAFLERIKTLAKDNTDFAFETTLSGKSHANILKQLRNTGYRVEIYYLWIPSAEFSARRVAERVANGGHDIPPEVINRRFEKSLRNLVGLYLPLADYVAVWDNSDVIPFRVLEKSEHGEIVFDQKIWQNIKEYSYESKT